MKRFSFVNPIFWLLCIFILGSVIRFVGLGQNPAGIVDDEADTAYDAYSILHTGKDQWGVAWPITSFRGFGDYRLPVYTYFVVPSVAAFGLTHFAVRFPAAFFGSLTIPLIYFFAKELFKNEREKHILINNSLLPLLSAFFLAISPWHIGMSRIGLEETTSVFFVSLGIFLLLVGRRISKCILLAAMLFGVSFYIYTANIIFIPLICVTTFVLFWREYKSRLRWIMGGILCLCLVSLPFMLSFGSNTLAARTKQVNLTNDTGTVDLVNEKRGSCEHIFLPTVCKMEFNKYGAYATKYISNYLNHFSPNLLSVYGTDSQYSILPSRGLLYLLDYPLLVVAVIAVFLLASPELFMLLAMLFISAIPDSFTSAGHYGRFFVSFPAWPILIAFGIIFVLSHVKYRKVLLLFVTLLFLIGAGSFIVEYWTFFPYRYSQFSHFGYEELVQKIRTNIPLYDTIIVSSGVNDSKQYIYYLFYTRYDPTAFQSGKGIEKGLESNGWIRVKRINSIEFVPDFRSYDSMIHAHDLLIGAPSEFQTYLSNMILTTPVTPVPIEFTVKDKAGNVLFEGIDSAKLYSAGKGI